MKLNKFFTFAALATVMFFTASCSDDFDYTPAAKPTGAQVFFPTSNKSSYELEMSENIQTFNVAIARVDSSEAMTIDIQSTVAQNVDAFAIPAQVSFAANEARTIIPISYDATTLGYENPDTLTISIGNENATPYGLNSYEFVVSIPSPLKLLGTGTFVEGFWYEGENPVEVYQNELDPNIFRIMNPFNEMTIYEGEDDADGTQSAYVDITILQPGEKLAGIQITQNDLVYFTPMSTGFYHPTYEDYVYLYHPAHFGGSFASEGAWLRSKVVDWQENGLPGRIQLAPFYFIPKISNGWDNTTADGLVYIDFPGYDPKDLSSEVLYAGIFNDAENNAFAVGNLTLGKDVETVKAAVVSASDNANAVANAIAAGTLQAVDVAAGRIEVPIAEGLTGKLQLVVVVLDGTDVKSVASDIFEYYGGGVSPWVEVGTGTYTYTAFFYDEDEDGNEIPYEDESLTIFKNNDDPTLYKVADWGMGVDFTFTWDGEDGTGVTVPTSYTGYTDKQYGPIYVSDFPTWGKSWGVEIPYEEFPCSYDAETSTFSFVVSYWDMDDPSYPWGQDIETLQVTWGDAAPAAARAAKAKNLQVKSKKTASNLKGNCRKNPFANGKNVKAEDVKTLKISAATPAFVK